MRQKLLLAFTLFFLISSAYLLIYRGHPLSIDEFNLFDSVESLVNRGELSRSIQFHRLDEVASVQPPRLIPTYEPLQILVNAPFYMFAVRFQSLGNFHTVLLTNIFITALTAISLFLIIMRLEYSTRTAWISALVFAFATLAVQYSRFLFREPLTGFFVLWAFYFAVEIGRSKQFRIGTLVGLALAVLGMLLTKQFSVMFLPGIFICLILSRLSIRRIAPYLLLFIAVLAIFFVAIAIINPDIGDDRYSFQRWLDPSQWGWDFMWESFLGYQISPSRSFWLYSPILLLSFWGSWLLIKRRQYAFVLATFVTLVLTSAIYGALRFGSFWDGGWSWGPRYLLPLVPLFMLLIAPVIERFSDMGIIKRGIVALLLIFSVGIQILGLGLPYLDFYVDTELKNPGITLESWSPDNWQWNSSQINYHLQHIDFTEWDYAWRFSDQPVVIPVIIVVSIIIAIAFSVYAFRKSTISRQTFFILSLIGVFVPLIIALIGMRSLRNDARYVEWRTDTQSLIREMNTLTTTEDIVLIEGHDLNTMLQFMNWFKSGSQYITLPDNRPIQLEVLNWADNTSDRTWFVSYTPRDLSPDSAGLERYMTDTLFPAEVISTSPQARATLYTFPTTDQQTQRITPQNQSGNLRLNSAEIPLENRYRGGEFVRIVLNWQIMNVTNTNYHVNVYLLNNAGQVVVQKNNLPQSGFGYTSTWLPDVVYNEHQALLIPETLANGSYSLNVTIYELLNGSEYNTISTIPISTIEIIEKEQSGS